MNYTQLCASLQSIAEDEFTADQLELFTRQAEQKLYMMARLPVLRKTINDALTPFSPSYTLPADFMYPVSLAVVTAGGYDYLLAKEDEFIREAYPDPATAGRPKYYAIDSATTLVVGPTPDVDSTSIVLTYGYFPESIVTASQTWLGDNFDTALLNAALMEVVRFQKGSPEDLEMYQKLYMEAMALFREFDMRIKQDEYRQRSGGGA